MKKIFIALSVIFLLLVSGCSTTLNTPSDKVEEFLSKYQNMDSEVLTQLDNVIAEDSSMNDDQKKEYRALLEKQYQNLSYKIKDEKIKGDTATVDVEIEVYDYKTSINKSKEYYKEHEEEFKEKTNENKEESSSTDDKTTIIEGEGFEKLSAFIDYKIKQLKSVTDKIKYEITFNLDKEDGKWKVEDISDIDRQKIHGLFEG